MSLFAPAPPASPSSPSQWRRRQLRRAAILVCVPGLAMGAATLAGAYAAGAFDNHPPATTEQVSLVAVPTRGSFALRVLNGSGRSGLAGGAAKALSGEGFRVTAVGNAPEHFWHDHTAVIWCGPDGIPGARLVAAQIPASRVLEDQRPGTGVEVILGTAYQAPPAHPGT